MWCCIYCIPVCKILCLGRTYHGAALHHLGGYLGESLLEAVIYWGRSHGLDGISYCDWGSILFKDLLHRSTTSHGKIQLISGDPRCNRVCQTVLSTVEVEYHFVSEMAIELLYQRNLPENMGFQQALDTQLYADNTTCIEWGNHVIGCLEQIRHIEHCVRGIFPDSSMGYYWTLLRRFSTPMGTVTCM